jgi:hypothetical protein
VSTPSAITSSPSLVDLELRERQLRQVVERGIAGAEVVERDAETVGPEDVQLADGFVAQIHPCSGQAGPRGCHVAIARRGAEAIIPTRRNAKL